MDGPAGRPVVAAFDVDRTVTTRDCVLPFLRRVGGAASVTARLAWSLARHPRVLAERDRDRIKALAARAAFTGRPMTEVQRVADEFAAELTSSSIREDVLARMTWHRDRGDEVVFVSASFAAYLHPLARHLGVVTGVVGTELVVGPDGRCTGDLAGGNCRGPAKVTRLHEWLDARMGGRVAVELWAYGDSPGDRELLADADVAIWVHEPLTPADER